MGLDFLAFVFFTSMIMGCSLFVFFLRTFGLWLWVPLTSDADALISFGGRTEYPLKIA